LIFFVKFDIFAKVDFFCKSIYFGISIYFAKFDIFAKVNMFAKVLKKKNDWHERHDRPALVVVQYVSEGKKF
jgi:hypothetical protein